MSETRLEDGRERDWHPRDPGDYLVEVCAECGIQLGSSASMLGSPSPSGRCYKVDPDGTRHASRGGMIVRAVLAHPLDQDDPTKRMMRRNRPGLFVCPRPLSDGPAP